MKKILIIYFVFCLTGCTGRVKRFVLPSDPSPECVRRVVKDKYGKDWPKAVLTWEGDYAPIILAAPSLGAKSDWITPDRLPRCKNDRPVPKRTGAVVRTLTAAPKYALGGLLRLFLNRRGELQTF